MFRGSDGSGESVGVGECFGVQRVVVKVQGLVFRVSEGSDSGCRGK